MSIKRVLLYGFSIAIILVFFTWLIGHLWVFIMLVITAFITIAVSTINETTIKQNKKTGSDNTDDQVQYLRQPSILRYLIKTQYKVKSPIELKVNWKRTKQRTRRCLIYKHLIKSYNEIINGSRLFKSWAVVSYI